MIRKQQYDKVCSFAQINSNANAAILIVVGGKHGDGFSTQIKDGMACNIPALLRDVANRIEQSTAIPSKTS